MGSGAIGMLSNLVARVGLGLFFLAAGVGHVLNFQMTIDGASILTDDPMMARAAALLATGALIFGGLTLITGYFSRLGALSLIVFLMGAAYLHGIVMEIAANTAAVLEVQASDKASQALNTLKGIATQGHQANVVKNLVLALVLVPYALGARKVRAKKCSS